jgi:predicted methyltransferase MtxX (methanogen marker protein 4)
VLDLKVVHAQELLVETLSPEEVGAALKGTNDVASVDLLKEPLLGLYARAVGPCDPYAVISCCT